MEARSLKRRDPMHRIASVAPDVLLSVSLIAVSVTSPSRVEVEERIFPVLNEVWDSIMEDGFAVS